MTAKVWIGKRESDVLTYEYFDRTITFWGSNTGNNYSYCREKRLSDNYGNEFTKFVLNCISQSIETFGDVEMHFYNNSFAYKLISLQPSLKQYIINMNSQQTFNLVRHKTLSRLWLNNTVAVPKFAYLSTHECSYDALVKKFPSYNRFVIQKNISGGGHGTYLLDQNNCEDVINNLSRQEAFLVSPYYEGCISLSCHVIIDEEKTTIFPISEQLLKYDDNRIAYCGNRYIDVNESISLYVKDIAKKVAKKLQKIGYRGISGFDFIFVKGRVLLIEINPRYQGSSYLINLSLRENNLPSLFEMNSTAFRNPIDSDVSARIHNMVIPYQSFTCFYSENQHNQIHAYPNNALIF